MDSEKTPAETGPINRKKNRSEIDAAIDSSEKNQQREIFSSLPLEKMDALKPFARQLTAKRIKKIKLEIELWLSVEKIEALGDLIVKFTPKQLRECGKKISPDILAKYRTALKEIRPGEKVADFIKNTIIKEAFGN